MARHRISGLFTSSNRRHHQQLPAAESFLSTMMEENISSAEICISRWASTSTISLFASNSDDALQFLRSVAELQEAIDFFSADDCPASHAVLSRSLARAQTLMQSAMRRLEREFSQILSASRDSLDPDTVPRSTSVSSTTSYSSGDGGSDDDDVRAAGDSISAVHTASAAAADDLRVIAEAMITAGYGRQCAKAYKLHRKSIVDEGLYRLGFERLTHIHKLDCGTLELKIRTWLAAAPIAVNSLFAGERMLCEHVFANSDALRDSCFTEVASTAAASFLAFPESVAKQKSSPEKLFRILDLYDAISGLWPKIECIFSSDGAATVRTQTLASQLKLAESARSTLAIFESAIQKDASKTLCPGGAVHPLTRYATNYIIFLADYADTLADIYAGFPLELPDSLPEPLFDSATSNSSEETPRGGFIALRMAWLLLVVLCKMDRKAEAYGTVALSYLFLANNVQYVAAKVRDSRLRLLLGDAWVLRHQTKAALYISSYERSAWAAVMATMTASEVAPVEAWDGMSRFNMSFEEACREQEAWVVADAETRVEVIAAVVSKIVPAYRRFYERCRTAPGGGGTEVVRFSPEDVRSRLCTLLGGSAGLDSGLIGGL